MASGSPSSRRQIAATSSMFSGVRRKPGRTSTACWANICTASDGARRRDWPPPARRAAEPGARVRREGATASRRGQHDDSRSPGKDLGHDLRRLCELLEVVEHEQDPAAARACPGGGDGPTHLPSPRAPRRWRSTWPRGRSPRPSPRSRRRPGTIRPSSAARAIAILVLPEPPAPVSVISLTCSEFEPASAAQPGHHVVRPAAWPGRAELVAAPKVLSGGRLISSPSAVAWNRCSGSARSLNRCQPRSVNPAPGSEPSGDQLLRHARHDDLAAVR